MLVKFLIKKQGKRNKVDDLAQVYMRVRGGRSVDVTVMIDLKVNPLWWDEKTEEYKTRVICPDKERKKVRNDIAAVRTFVKDPSIVGSMSGYKEGSKALARYRDIDQDIKKDALSVFE